MLRGLSVLALCLLLLSQSVLAARYTRGINDSGWQAVTSVFECRLEHEVPYFGRATFRTRAGENSAFYLTTQARRFDAGEAQVVFRQPAYRRDLAPATIGVVPVKRGTRPMWLNSRYAEKMLAELNNGFEIEFLRKAWFEEPEMPDMRLVVSSIGFREQYRSYLACLTELLPANFDQIERTALYFEPNVTSEEEALSSEIRRQLDNILQLVKHDDSIRRFFIDGHASAPGDMADNLELSKRRAEKVTDYLITRGIPEDWITTRWHGERYPVASNGTAAGRAKNRRVTVRLERIEEIDVLPLAANTEK